MIRYILVAGLLVVGVSGQEKIDLSTAITRPAITAYEPMRLTLDWQQAQVEIVLRATSEDCNTPGMDRASCFRTFRYSGAEATTMMTQLNTANLSTISLRRRILQRLVDDKHLVGTVQ